MGAAVGGLAVVVALVAVSLRGQGGGRTTKPEPADAGKAVYDEAVALDEGGHLVEASEKYDAVCRRAPDSNLCDTAISQASDARMRLAKQHVEALKFVEAEAVLLVVEDSPSAGDKKKAGAFRASKEFAAGLQWEKALAFADKRAAQKEMEILAISATRIASKAAEWLAKERPQLLLADATAACTPIPKPTCLEVSDQLLKLHPNTPEAAKATEYAAAFAAAEKSRIYPLLVQAEKLIGECQKDWKNAKVHQNCLVQHFAMDPDNAFFALAACGERDSKTKDKIQTSFTKVVSDIALPTTTTPLTERFRSACEDGEYVKTVPPKPASPEREGAGGK